MSVENLAARLDEFSLTGAFIAESEKTVTISNLSIEATREVFKSAGALGWPVQAFDSAETQWSLEALDEDFAPFRVTLDKPDAPADTLRLLTNAGFSMWLDRDDPRPNWQVAGLNDVFSTVGVEFGPWRDKSAFPHPKFDHRSPRTLVREFGSHRQAPASLRLWLLLDGKDLALENPAFRVWAEKASRALILSLPDEFDSDASRLRFKGPPRLDLVLPIHGDDMVAQLKAEGVATLQVALRWVFEIERETEMRHILLATEIARCGGTGEHAAQFLTNNLEVALEGAKTAYQVQLAGISSDSLKTLAELRKSVTDETAKLADATRQIIASVASALAIGSGLIAARLTTAASPLLVTVVMGVAAAYVATTILSGVLFTLLQRKVRKEWQPRLYRFLSKTDYDALVGRPARMAEAALWGSALIGGVAVLVISGAVLLFAPPSNDPKPGQRMKAPGISVHTRLPLPPNAAATKPLSTKAKRE